MTSSIDDSHESTSVREEIASLLDNVGSDPPDVFETILECVEERPVKDVEQGVDSLVDDDRDRTDVFTDMLDELTVEPYLSDGTDAQRALIATVQRLVAKHSPNRRDALVPVLVDGLSDPARRDQVAQALADICSYSHTIAGNTIDELENAPASLFSDPAAVDAVTDVVSSIEESHHRYRGEVKLPAVARLQIGTERDAAKRELVNRVEQSESKAEEIVESVNQLLATVDDDGPESRGSRQAAREIMFKAAITSPAIVVSYADRLVDATGVDDERAVNAYGRVLKTDVDAAEELFASVVADAAEHQVPGQRVEAVASLLPGAPSSIVSAIVEEVRQGALDPPPIQEETRGQLHDDSHYLLALLWTDATAPIGERLIAMELEQGETRLATDIATVFQENPHGHLADGFSNALHHVDALPEDVADELASGITPHFQRDDASAEIAAKLAAPAPAVGHLILERVLAEQDGDDGESAIQEKTFQDFVEDVAKIDPAVIASQSAPLIAHAFDGTSQSSILTSIGDALDRAPVSVVEDTSSVLNLAVALLDHEDEEVVVHGCRLVAHLEPYPAPGELEDLADDAEGVVERRADWALEYIDDASRGLETDLFDAPDNLKPAVRHLVKQGVVKYRSGHAWDDLRLGPLEVNILNSIAAYYNRERSALVTHPAHDPRITLLYAIALLCEGAVDGEPPKVGIASPVYGHKKRWGTFGDIEDEYRNYGINDNGGDTVRAVTFDDLFGTSRVKEGQIATENRGDQVGTLVLSKSLGNLSQVADELTAVVVQAVERFKIPSHELIDRINEDFGGTPVFPIYSATTKQDTGGVPDIAPPSNLADLAIDAASMEASLSKTGDKLPDVNAVRGAARSLADDDGSMNRLSPPIRGVLEAAGYTWPKEITVRAVGSDSLRESIDDALDIGFDLDTCGSKVLNTTFRFERLPVHASDFDAWVEEKEVVNPWSRVDTIGDQLDYIEGSTDRDHIGSSITIAVRDGVRALDKVNDEFQNSNPLFERLLSRLEETVDDSERVGIVLARQTFADVLGEVLDEELDAPLGEDVVILTPEDVSSLLVLDRLFVVGPQRPSHAAVYFPSCTSQVEVLTVGTFWENYIEKHASRYRSELAEGLAVDSNYLGELSVTTEDETTVVEEPEPHTTAAASGTLEAGDSSNVASGPGESGAAGSEAARSGGGGSSGSGTWLPDSLTEAFERAAEVEGEHGEGEGGYGSSPTYEVQTEQGETLQLGRGEAIYKIEGLPGEGQSYSWTAPSNVESDDEILVIEPAFFKPRRDEWLQRQYEQQFDDPEAVLQGLYKWWTAMSEILQELDSEMRSRSSVVQAFYKAVKAAGVEKTKTTVRLWIKAIEESDSPIGLATVSEGTKGPDQAEDIEAIGSAFDDPRLDDDAEAIESALDDVREFNAIGGRQYRKVIETRLQEGHPAFREAATPHVAIEARKLDQDDT
jgi:hypothetical protein